MKECECGNPREPRARACTRCLTMEATGYLTVLPGERDGSRSALRQRRYRLRKKLRELYELQEAV